MSSTKGIYCLFLISLLLATALPAQQTATYYDLDREYKKGLELFDSEDYVNAREIFGRILEQDIKATDQEMGIILVNAEYYRAISSVELQNPDAELLLKGFVDNHTGNAKSNLAKFHLGTLYYHKRKYSDAIRYFEQVETFELTREQMDDYNFQLAYAYFFRKDFDNARQYFSRVKDTKKYFYPGHYYHGFISFLENDYDVALKDFKVVEESAYFGQVVPFYITSIYFQQQKYDQVVDYAQPLLDQKKLKYYAEINQLVGKAYFEKEEYGKAQPYLEYYSENTPRLAKEDIYQLGFVQYKAGDYDEAIRNFEQLSRERDSIGQSALYMLGDAYISADEKIKARNAFREAAQIEGNRFIRENALFNYGKVSYELGYHNTAINTFKEFLLEFPRSKDKTEAQELLTNIFLETRNYKDAITILDDMPDKTPKMKQAYQKVAFYRGVELYQDGDYSGADKFFSKSLEFPIDNSTEAQVYFWKAEVNMLQDSYNRAIANYNKFLNLAKMAKDLPATSSVPAANYGMGYAYFKSEGYYTAARHFQETLNTLGQLPNNPKGRKLRDELMADATLRLADSQFMERDYNNALGNYDKVVKNDYPAGDYAMFQKGVLYDLLKQPQEKIRQLQNLVSRYPNSRFYDAAYYGIAYTHFLESNYDEAMDAFQEVLKSDKSKFRVQALQHLALIHFKQNNDDMAVQYYREIINNYPGTTEAKDAMQRVLDIYSETGKESYVKGLDYDPTKLDTAQFQAALTSYQAKNCQEAISGFSKYLNDYSGGFFELLAHHYRADCHYREKDYEKAEADYEFVINHPNNANYAEVAYLRSAKINHFIQKDYETAFGHYRELLNVASYKNSTTEALQGLVITSFETGKFSHTIQYANELLDQDGLNQDVQVMANYYLGKAAFSEGDNELAMEAFTKTTEMSSGEKAAEAKYHIARIHYLRNNHKLAEATADDIIKNHASYQYWLVKTYLLIADIFIAAGDYQQAQFTLQSITDGYSGDQDLLGEARQKLRMVNEKLDGGSRIKRDDDENLEPEGPGN